MIMSLLVCKNTSAQQDPLHSQYTFNALAYNPAFAGSEDHLVLMASSRHQWVGFEGAPSTQYLMGHAPLKSNMGLGLTLFSDRLGPANQTGFYVDFSYKLKLDESSKLSFGLKGGGNLWQANFNDLEVYEAGDATFSGAIESAFLPNFGFGIQYQYTDKFYAAVSLPRLVQNEYNGNTDSEIDGEFRHFFVMAGYKHSLNSNVVLEPTFILRRVQNAPIAFDINVNAIFNKKFKAGLMYRLGNALGAQLQYSINDKMSIGYAYDLSTTALGQNNSGTHEIMMRFDFLGKKAATESEVESASPTVD